MSSDKHKRILVPVKVSMERVSVNGDVVEFLRGEARNYGVLLAHCEGGVVWGRVDGSALILAPGADAVFTAATLQEARLFGDDGELHVWRVGDAVFRGRRLSENANQAAYEHAFEESQILWGDRCEAKQDGFSLLAEGMQGLRHWAPVTISNEKRCRVRLLVRSYVSSQGAAYVQDARLVRVEVEGG